LCNNTCNKEQTYLTLLGHSNLLIDIRGHTFLTLLTFSKFTLVWSSYLFGDNTF